MPYRVIARVLLVKDNAKEMFYKLIVGILLDTPICDRSIASFKTTAMCFINAYKLIEQDYEDKTS